MSLRGKSTQTDPKPILGLDEEETPPSAATPTLASVNTTPPNPTSLRTNDGKADYKADAKSTEANIAQPNPLNIRKEYQQLLHLIANGDFLNLYQQLDKTKLPLFAEYEKNHKFTDIELGPILRLLVIVYLHNNTARTTIEAQELFNQFRQVFDLFRGHGFRKELQRSEQNYSSSLLDLAIEANNKVLVAYLISKDFSLLHAAQLKIDKPESELNFSSALQESDAKQTNETLISQLVDQAVAQNQSPLSISHSEPNLGSPDQKDSKDNPAIRINATYLIEGFEEILGRRLNYLKRIPSKYSPYEYGKKCVRMSWAHSHYFHLVVSDHEKNQKLTCYLFLSYIQEGDLEALKKIPIEQLKNLILFVTYCTRENQHVALFSDDHFLYNALTYTLYVMQKAPPNRQQIYLEIIKFLLEVGVDPSAIANCPKRREQKFPFYNRFDGLFIDFYNLDEDKTTFRNFHPCALNYAIYTGNVAAVELFIDWLSAKKITAFQNFNFLSLTKALQFNGYTFDSNVEDDWLDGQRTAISIELPIEMNDAVQIRFQNFYEILKIFLTKLSVPADDVGSFFFLFNRVDWSKCQNAEIQNIIAKSIHLLWVKVLALQLNHHLLTKFPRDPDEHLLFLLETISSDEDKVLCKILRKCAAKDQINSILIKVIQKRLASNSAQEQLEGLNLDYAQLILNCSKTVIHEFLNEAGLLSHDLIRVLISNQELIKPTIDRLLTLDIQPTLISEIGCLLSSFKEKEGISPDEQRTEHLILTLTCLLIGGESEALHLKLNCYANLFDKKDGTVEKIIRVKSLTGLLTKVPNFLNGFFTFVELQLPKLENIILQSTNNIVALTELIEIYFCHFSKIRTEASKDKIKTLLQTILANLKIKPKLSAYAIQNLIELINHIKNPDILKLINSQEIENLANILLSILKGMQILYLPAAEEEKAIEIFTQKYKPLATAGAAASGAAKGDSKYDESDPKNLSETDTHKKYSQDEITQFIRWHQTLQYLANPSKFETKELENSQEVFNTLWLYVLNHANNPFICEFLTQALIKKYSARDKQAADEDYTFDPREASPPALLTTVILEIFNIANYNLNLTLAQSLAPLKIREICDKVLSILPEFIEGQAGVYQLPPKIEFRTIVKKCLAIFLEDEIILEDLDLWLYKIMSGRRKALGNLRSIYQNRSLGDKQELTDKFFKRGAYNELYCLIQDMDTTIPRIFRLISYIIKYAENLEDNTYGRVSAMAGIVNLEIRELFRGELDINIRQRLEIEQLRLMPFLLEEQFESNLKAAAEFLIAAINKAAQITNDPLYANYKEEIINNALKAIDSFTQTEISPEVATCIAILIQNDNLPIPLEWKFKFFSKKAIRNQMPPENQLKLMFYFLANYDELFKLQANIVFGDHHIRENFSDIISEYAPLEEKTDRNLEFAQLKVLLRSMASNDPVLNNKIFEKISIKIMRILDRSPIDSLGYLIELLTEENSILPNYIISYFLFLSTDFIQHGKISIIELAKLFPEAVEELLFLNINLAKNEVLGMELSHYFKFLTDLVYELSKQHKFRIELLGQWIIFNPTFSSKFPPNEQVRILQLCFNKFSELPRSLQDALFRYLFTNDKLLAEPVTQTYLVVYFAHLLKHGKPIADLLFKLAAKGIKGDKSCTQDPPVYYTTELAAQIDQVANQLQFCTKLHEANDKRSFLQECLIINSDTDQKADEKSSTASLQTSNDNPVVTLRLAQLLKKEAELRMSIPAEFGDLFFKTIFEEIFSILAKENNLAQRLIDLDAIAHSSFMLNLKFNQNSNYEVLTQELKTQYELVVKQAQEQRTSIIERIKTKELAMMSAIDELIVNDISMLRAKGGLISLLPFLTLHSDRATTTEPNSEITQLEQLRKELPTMELNQDVCVHPILDRYLTEYKNSLGVNLALVLS